MPTSHCTVCNLYTRYEHHALRRHMVSSKAREKRVQEIDTLKLIACVHDEEGAAMATQNRPLSCRICVLGYNVV
jgi:hypothetical protein